MPIDLFRGDLVRLTAEEPPAVSQAFANWNLNSELMRLLDNDPVPLWSIKKLEAQAEIEKNPAQWIEFMVRRLSDDCLVGFVGLFWLNPSQGEAFTGVGIGDPQLWGKGYGTDAIRLLLRYAFNELNLRRISLMAFEYNQRALRSYHKAGFVEEGRMRGVLHREGRRWDSIYMGILRDEWLKLYPEP
jgi:RimJ/RimL family protein N-acetyltransferase